MFACLLGFFSTLFNAIPKWVFKSSSSLFKKKKIPTNLASRSNWILLAIYELGRVLSKISAPVSSAEGVGIIGRKG